MILPTNQLILTLLFLCNLSFVKCGENGKSFEELNQMLSDARNFRYSRGSESSSPVWLEYEFETDAGNREELIVTNVSIHENPQLPKNELNWQYVEANGSGYLATAAASVLSFHKFRPDNANLIDEPVTLEVTGKILKFKIVTLDVSQNNSDIYQQEIVAVLCVESDSGTSLQWFKLSEKGFEIFWQLPVQKHVKDLEFIQHGYEIRILLLVDETTFGKQYSPLDVCTVTINFLNLDYSSWLCQTILLPRTFHIQVCSSYERVLLALQGMDFIYLYEYKNTAKGIFLQPLVSLKSHSLKNFVCFESGYVQYLAISGPQAGLFNFFENEFQFNSETETYFESVEIVWVKDIPLDTYRDESLLLIQLKNSSIIALAWQGLTFYSVSLPNDNLNGIDLSKSTAIPKFGLISENKIFKLDVKLKDLRRSVHDNTERIVKLQAVLKEVLEHQDKVLNETEALVNKSYLKNPEITGFWDIPHINVTNATIGEKVTFEAASIGSTNLTVDDLYFNPIAHTEKLKNIEEKLHEIHNTLEKAIDSNVMDINFDSDLEIIGNINITESMTVGNLTVDFINNASVPTMLSNSMQEPVNIKESSLTPVETENLQVSRVNGISINDIIFDDARRNYSNVDFSKVKKLIINGNLNVTALNAVNWKNLISHAVWKNKATFINCTVTVNGTVIADDGSADVINNKRYPDDYILSNVTSPVDVTGTKTIDKLTVTNLLGVKYINDISIDNFVILNNDNVLEGPIIFENLTVEGKLQVDGNITGFDLKPNLSLNETFNISINIIFTNLKVLGNIILEESVDGKQWTDFEDLLQGIEEKATISGDKTFLGDVEIQSKLTIKSNKINGRNVSEFLTTDTEQILPNLKRIRNNVTFGQVRYGVIKKLEKLLTQCKKNGNSSFKKLIFEAPLSVNNLSFDKINNNVSKEEFERNLNRTMEKVYFENLTLTELSSEDILVDVVNDIDLLKLNEEIKSSNTTDDDIIENLEVEKLNVTFINGMTVEEFQDVQNYLKLFHQEILSGNLSLQSLQVKGKIDTVRINGKNVSELLSFHQKGIVIFEKDVYIENLTILGTLNGFNFTELVSDSVLKDSDNIIITGKKIFNNIDCKELQTMKINGHNIDSLYDSTKEQVFSGPIIVNGTVNVLKNFETKGNIGRFPFQSFINRFNKTGKGSYYLSGNLLFSDNVHIENLTINGPIQDTLFSNILETLVYRNEDNVTISGRKVFKAPVTFKSDLNILNQLNDMNLKNFYEKAIFIDKPFTINSKLLLKDGLTIEKLLTVKKNFVTPFMNGVDMNELEASVIYLNRPSALSELMTFKNVTFQDNINIQKLNKIDMNLLIPLHTDQLIESEVIKCKNVSVEKFDLGGRINTEKLDDIYTNTLMLFGDQTLTGNTTFLGKVYVRRNFDPKTLNGISPKQIALFNTKEKLKGKFVFKKPIVLNQDLQLFGYLNGIDLSLWKSEAVSKTAPFKQIVSGNWTVQGNVSIGKDSLGIDTINGVNLTELVKSIEEKRLELSAIQTQRNVKLEKLCKQINVLKTYAEQQAYMFRTFELMQILVSNNNVISVNHFEIEDQDYLFISFDTCEMKAFLFTGEKFEFLQTVSNFGTIDQWTLKNNNVLYFLTIAQEGCQRSPMNLWKFENDEFTHILDFGNKTVSDRMSEETFLALINSKLERRSIAKTHEDVKNSVVSAEGNRNFESTFDNDRIFSARHQFIDDYESSRKYPESHQDNSEAINFKVGVFQKELFLYYDDVLSMDNIFICSHDTSEKKILQTLTAHKPNSFLVLNFEGMIETLLIFIENGIQLRIYEYKGIQGFVYRDTINIPAEKLYSFKMRKYTNLVKKHYVVAINRNRISILEARMHGERLDMENFACERY